MKQADEGITSAISFPIKSSKSRSMRAIFRISWRYLSSHLWQTVLMVVGIALGVAVVVAIDLANASAMRGFDLSTAAVVGRTTHQVIPPPGGLDENLYTNLRKNAGLEKVAPVVVETVYSSRLGEQPMQLLGIDPFAEAPFRDYLTGTSPGSRFSRDTRQKELIAFLSQPGAVLISADLAGRYDLSSGSDIDLVISGHSQTVTVVGLLEPEAALVRRALENLILADIATAQELTGNLGKLSRIDMILPPDVNEDGQAVLQKIELLLPNGASIRPVESRRGSVAEMTRAFQINLSAMSLLALVVGLFLIYNTMTFSVVQRRPLFGTLRCLGVTTREIILMVIGEALIVGFLGSFLGLLLGVMLGQGAVRLVTQTINDLFFVISVRGVQIPFQSLVKGALLGVLATVFAAFPPAREAAASPARLALSRSDLEVKAHRAVLWAGLAGFLLILLGVFVLSYPSDDLLLSFAATFTIIFGFALLAPLATILLMRLMRLVSKRFFGSLARMAPRDVINSLSRTAIAIAALMVAVSVTIGVSLMVSSFRHTVELWLEQILVGDVYISVYSPSNSQSLPSIDPQVLDIVRNTPGVERVFTLRTAMIGSQFGEVLVNASSNPDVASSRSYVWLNVPESELGDVLQRGSVLITEPFANRFNLNQGVTSVFLDTLEGTLEFPIAGVFYDYASTTGSLLMDQAVFRRYWGGDEVNAIALKLESAVDPDEITNELRFALTDLQQLSIQPNRALRQEALQVFNRTFAITTALQLLATLVAFIGVLSALLSLQLERQREFGILRSIGLTIRQLWALVLLETGLMGGTAGILAMPTGFTLAVILIYIINRRSFGWTLQMSVDPEPFLFALFLAVGAALLAGLYPAWKIASMSEAEAMHYE